MKKLTPFNIDLMFASDRDVFGLTPVTSIGTYDGASSNFDPNGLFSTDIFGRVGTPERESKFSYIKLNASVIHPAVFEVLKKLKSLYIDILFGKAYAYWDDERKDFFPGDMITGDTGFAFFTSHLKELDPDRRKSNKRNMYIDVFTKYKDRCLMHNCLVIPAMYRDLTVEGDGKEVQDEVNEFYRKLIAAANSVNLVAGRMNDRTVDNQRRSLQIAMNDIYTYLKNMLEGKKGMIQGKWGSRRIAYGTRNVISSIETTADELGSPTAPHVDDVQIGLLQTIKGALPFTIKGLKDKFLDDIFIDIRRPVNLYNPKTLQPVSVNLETDVWDKWTTLEGLEKLITGFSDTNVRNKPVLIQGNCLALVYKKNNQFKIIKNHEEIPELAQMYVKPITYSELFYLCNYEKWYELKALCTRYPINNMYSIYPARIYTRTTVDSTPMEELDNDYQTVIGLARAYPNTSLDAAWINTAIPSFTRLSSLGADFKL